MHAAALLGIHLLFCIVIVKVASWAFEVYVKGWGVYCLQEGQYCHSALAASTGDPRGTGGYGGGGP